MSRQPWWVAAKKYMDSRTTVLGHRPLAWKKLPRSAGTAVIFEGTCTDCGATVAIDRTSSSSRTIRCARDVECSGPGTAVLTEIEQRRASELFAGLLGDYRSATDGLFD